MDFLKNVSSKNNCFANMKIGLILYTIFMFRTWIIVAFFVICNVSFYEFGNCHKLLTTNRFVTWVLVITVVCTE